MKDRISLNPGRMLVTPENGGAAYYATLTRADNPTQEGDSLSKNTLLKDSTAEALGLSDAALPDDALRILSRLHAGLGNEYLWSKITTSAGIIEGGMITTNILNNATIQYSKTINTSNGTVTLENANVTYPNVTNSASLLEGMYFSLPDVSTAVYKYVSLVIGGVYSDITGNIITYGSTGEVVGYVNSPNPNAYPPAEDDGYTYQALGMLGEKVRTGSYAGTNTYGASNPNSLALDFTPKLVVIVGVRGTMRSAAIIGESGGLGFALISSSGTISAGPLTSLISENTISWYATTNSGEQQNYSGATYTYYAIG